MPRGRKNLSLDEQIIRQQELITTLKSEIRTAEERLADLENQKETIELQKLRLALSAQGKTIDEVLKALNNTQSEKPADELFATEGDAVLAG